MKNIGYSQTVILNMGIQEFSYWCIFTFCQWAAFRSHPIGHMKVRGVKCVPQTKAWSPCSKSCGTGVSTRLTNSNTHCNLTKETRICQIRPCSLTTFNRVKVHLDKFIIRRCAIRSPFQVNTRSSCFPLTEWSQM